MVKDPEALKNWPPTLSRDGARTPLPWAAGESHAGFSSVDPWLPLGAAHGDLAVDRRSEEHTSEVQSLMRISYAVFCLKKKNTTNENNTRSYHDQQINTTRKIIRCRSIIYHIN